MGIWSYLDLCMGVGRVLAACILVTLHASGCRAFSIPCLGGALKLRNSAMPPVVKRIGIVGGGVAGSSLAKVLKDKGMAVTVFEMGRGAGGRMATRKSREIPGLSINHGAPVTSTPLFLTRCPGKSTSASL